MSDRSTFDDPLELPADIDMPAIQAGKMRAAAIFLDDAVPTFARAALELAAIFEAIHLLSPAGVGHSAEIASRLREVAGRLPEPSAAVVARLRHIADERECSGRRMN
jgi:hypothetical protein